MKFHKGRRAKRGRIEIIPMIDVMFFLLATFILASLALQNIHSLGINLPSGDISQATPGGHITLTITKDGSILLNNATVTLDSLANELRPMLKGKEDNIIVAADNDSSHGVVTLAMLEARKAGAEHFMIAIKGND
ncbi:MAG: biopolymer transporter ExbD [Candidatus Magnetominusculus sp. LBB02]|nr:biopolymer transporter ExbD [Candidatus Magnetominusculus sp. LBB02]